MKEENRSMMVTFTNIIKIVINLLSRKLQCTENKANIDNYYYPMS